MTKELRLKIHEASVNYADKSSDAQMKWDAPWPNNVEAFEAGADWGYGEAVKDAAKLAHKPDQFPLCSWCNTTEAAIKGLEGFNTETGSS